MEYIVKKVDKENVELEVNSMYSMGYKVVALYGYDKFNIYDALVRILFKKIKSKKK